MVCRRAFIKMMAAGAASTGTIACGGGGAVSGPLTPPSATARTIRTALPAVGETRAEFDGDLALAVTRVSATSVVAVSRTCTHEGCTVQYLAAQAGIWCACHNGRFDVEGRVLSGPPPRPLPSYAIREDDQGNVLVSTERT